MSQQNDYLAHEFKKAIRYIISLQTNPSTFEYASIDSDPLIGYASIDSDPLIGYAKLLDAAMSPKLFPARLYDPPIIHKEVPEIEINSLNQRQRDIERRLVAVECKLNMHVPRKSIEQFASSFFLQMQLVEYVYTDLTDFGLTFIIIHSSENVSDTIVQIQPGFLKLDDKFPNMYFERRIFHSEDVQDKHLQQYRLIFKR